VEISEDIEVYKGFSGSVKTGRWWEFINMWLFLYLI